MLHDEHSKGHSRREHRSIQIVSIAAGIDFPHARLAIRLTRTRADLNGDHASCETVYAVTSLDWFEDTPPELAAIVRGHWAIENRVHHVWDVRDVTFQEDRSQVRTGTGPRVMATLRNIAIGLI